jgi:cell surface protein SprA
VNSFTQNLLYTEDANHNPTNTDTIGNFIPRFDLQQVTITEQLAPLIGIDMTFKNSLQARFEIKRDRTLSLAYSNIQVTEVRGIEYTIGLGYKFKRVVLPFRTGNSKKLSNDLTVKADVSLRDNTTILRKAVENTNQPSAGSRTLGVKLSADYPVSDRFNVRFYYDYNATDPFVSSSYPTSNTNAGLSIRFTLAQ